MRDKPLMYWPTHGEAVVHTLFAGNPYLGVPVCKVDLLGASDGLKFHQGVDGMHVTLPPTAAAAGLSDAAYVLRIHTKCAR